MAKDRTCAEYAAAMGGKRLTARSLAEALERPEAMVRHSLRLLHDLQIVRQNEDGTWELRRPTDSMEGGR